MRAINKEKSKILSAVYKKWVDELDTADEKHPTSSKTHNDFYIDVLMNLLYCQKGVCAYTEMPLCEPELLTPDNWENGKYQIKDEKPERFGEIDHFNPDKKDDKYWDLENLFVVLERVNRLKRTKKVADRFKPDSPEYAPENFLEYDFITGRFRPQLDIKNKDLALYNSIEEMIKVLNLNYGLIPRERKKFLRQIVVYRRINEPIQIDRFFTACRMTGLYVEEAE